MNIHSMKLHIVLFSLLVVTLAGCTAATTTENLAGARLLIENNDFASAQSMCDEVRNAVESDDSDVEVEDLCKLAILYMQLADHTDRDDNVEYARQAYMQSLECDSAGAMDYYSRLGVDEMAQVVLLSSIVRSTTAVPEIDEQGDTLLIVPDDDSYMIPLSLIHI